jgi:hypothetical protein
MCFHLIESKTHQTKPSELVPFLCQINNFSRDLHLYMRANYGIKRKCQSTLHGVPIDLSTNLLVLHFGRCCIVFKASQKGTQPFVQA